MLRINIYYGNFDAKRRNFNGKYFDHESSERSPTFGLFVKLSDTLKRMNKKMYTKSQKYSKICD